MNAADFYTGKAIESSGRMPAGLISQEIKNK
jgi:hypothetical protein